MSLFQEGFQKMFPETILSDSRCGGNTLETYQNNVNTSYQQLCSLCSENNEFYTTVHNMVTQKYSVLDKLADNFASNSKDMMIFQSEEDAKELIQIVLLDVKKVILDKALSVIEERKASLQQAKKERHRSIEREISDYTPTSSTKKKRPNLPVHAKDILSTWFREHVDHPYPTQSEKMELSELTGLSLQKVDNWFINERSRKWQTYRQK